jgi:hypothetical protein
VNYQPRSLRRQFGAIVPSDGQERRSFATIGIDAGACTSIDESQLGIAARQFIDPHPKVFIEDIVLEPTPFERFSEERIGQRSPKNRGRPYAG